MVFSTVQQPPPMGIPTVSGGGEFFTLEMSQEEIDKMASRLDKSAPRVYVFKEANPSGSRTKWDAFSIPKSCAEMLADVGERRSKSCVNLLAPNGETIVQIDRPWPPDTTWESSALRAATWKPRLTFDPEHHYWLGPFFWIGLSPYTPGYSSAFIIEETADIELKKLRDRDKATAFIEKVAN